MIAQYTVANKICRRRPYAHCRTYKIELQLGGDSRSTRCRHDDSRARLSVFQGKGARPRPTIYGFGAEAADTAAEGAEKEKAAARPYAMEWKQSCPHDC